MLMPAYVIVSLVLFLFSYTQVDLSLTISRVSVFQTVQKAFQYIGFYQRPAATLWYIGVLLALFVLYLAGIAAARKRELPGKQVWIIIGVLSFVLLFSYPAFSYDIYNYMFTAKTVLLYHKNPYEVVPLQFTGVEPWLSFMRWTHLPSAYTPLWIFLSLLPYLMGLGYFITTLLSMKAIAVGFYLLCAWYIQKILQKTEAKSVILGVWIFALNPLVIIETLVSGHNDIVMMAFAMMSLYAIAGKRNVYAFFAMAVATAFKFMTIFLVPVMMFGFRPLWYLAAMTAGLVVVVLQREILPWYWVWIMPFVALIPNKKEIVYIAIAMSLALLLRYAPYFYFGHWNDPVPLVKWWVTIVPPLITVLLLTRKRMRQQK